MKRNACQKCVFAVDDDKPHCGLRGFRSDFNVERCSAENDTVPNGYELQEDGKKYPYTLGEYKNLLKERDSTIEYLNRKVRDLEGGINEYRRELHKLKAKEKENGEVS